jgi:hypothetical protein
VHRDRSPAQIDDDIIGGRDGDEEKGGPENRNETNPKQRPKPGWEAANVVYPGRCHNSPPELMPHRSHTYQYDMNPEIVSRDTH